MAILRAQKAAWESYLFASFTCGLFEGERGQEIRGRFASPQPEDFRSAMAECMACWLLAGVLKLRIEGTARGRMGKNLDMAGQAGDCQFGVEVKAPLREFPADRVWIGNDSDKIAEAITAANKQFDDTTANLLVVTPVLRTKMFNDREDILRAVFGESRTIVQINKSTGRAVGKPENRFDPIGKFLNTGPRTGKKFKPDGLPAYRRVSAILCIEEKVMHKYPSPNPFDLLDKDLCAPAWLAWSRGRDRYSCSENESWIEHDVLVIHNPYAYHALPADIWGKYPQLVPVGDVMSWTDGVQIAV